MELHLRVYAAEAGLPSGRGQQAHLHRSATWAADHGLAVAVDIGHGPRENWEVARPGASRQWIARRLGAAYAGGLLSDDTFALRLDQAFRAGLIDRAALVGDLNLRGERRSVAARIALLVRRVITPLVEGGRCDAAPAVLLALEWRGEQPELLIGRHDSCDVVLSDPTVSRQHARLVFRDSRWIVQDLRSTNGTLVNGTLVGRCEVRPGDHLMLGDEHLEID